MGAKSSRPKSSPAARPTKSSQVAAPSQSRTQELDTAAMDPDHRLAFKLEFTHVTEDTVTQKVKMAKRHCVQVRKELVILPANRRPRRAALLAASSKAEKYRGAWETLQNLIKVVNELSNRFPIPDDSCYAEGQAQGSGANSLGPLGLTASPSALQQSGGMGNSPYQQDYNDDSSSTDS